MENQGVEPTKKNLEKSPLAKPEFVDPSEERARDEEILRDVPPIIHEFQGAIENLVRPLVWPGQ